MSLKTVNKHNRKSRKIIDDEPFPGYRYNGEIYTHKTCKCRQRDQMSPDYGYFRFQELID